MTLRFYNISDDPRTVRKNIGSIVKTESQVYAKEPLDFLAPVFILTGLQTANQNLNYLFCVELNRYYFIKDFINVMGGKTEVHCEIDVLMTYADAIGNTDVIVYNQGSAAFADNLIKDGRLPLQVNTESRTFGFVGSELTPVGWGDHCYVLNVYGGGNS